jgi:hypothetical protein
MCGQYPGAFEDQRNDRLLKKLLSKGIDTFVCLQAEMDDDIPEDVWRSGIGLRPYFEDAQKLSKRLLKWAHLPIVDGGVAPDDVTVEFAEYLAADLMAGRVLYIHCWGGHGRTGVFLALLLSYLYRISASEALKRVQAYHDCRIEGTGVKSPQTVVQRDQVKRLVAGMLFRPAPDVTIMPQLAPLTLDAGKRGSMKPMVKSSQTASCPAIGGADGESGTPTTRTRKVLKTSVHENALPDYLQLPTMPGASAKTRRDAAMRQKAAAAALRRKPLKHVCALVL